MTGQFTEKDPERCAHYARFMKGLNIKEANAVFWLLFAMVIVMMCLASVQHHKNIQLTDAEKGHSEFEKKTRRYRSRIRRRRMHFLSIATLCFFIAIICVIMECFALFNIEFCDGEDLMPLYWGFWSVLQVGSLIAIAGVMVQFWIVLGNVETPSWAVALGTPVLVFAALGWVFRNLWKRMIAKYKGSMYEESDSSSSSSSSGEESGDEKDGEEYWTDDRSHAFQRGEFKEDLHFLMIPPLRFPSPLPHGHAMVVQKHQHRA